MMSCVLFIALFEFVLFFFSLRQICWNTFHVDVSSLLIPIHLQPSKHTRATGSALIVFLLPTPNFLQNAGLGSSLVGLEGGRG